MLSTAERILEHFSRLRAATRTSEGKNFHVKLTHPAVVIQTKTLLFIEIFWQRIDECQEALQNLRPEMRQSLREQYRSISFHDDGDGDDDDDDDD